MCTLTSKSRGGMGVGVVTDSTLKILVVFRVHSDVTKSGGVGTEGVLRIQP